MVRASELAHDCITNSRSRHSSSVSTRREIFFIFMINFLISKAGLSVKLALRHWESIGKALPRRRTKKMLELMWFLSIIILKNIAWIVLLWIISYIHCSLLVLRRILWICLSSQRLSLIDKLWLRMVVVVQASVTWLLVVWYRVGLRLVIILIRTYVIERLTKLNIGSEKVLNRLLLRLYLLRKYNLLIAL